MAEESCSIHTLETQRPVELLGRGLLEIDQQPHTSKPSIRSPFAHSPEQHTSYSASTIFRKHRERIDIVLTSLSLFLDIYRMTKHFTHQCKQRLTQSVQLPAIVSNYSSYRYATHLGNKSIAIAVLCIIPCCKLLEELIKRMRCIAIECHTYNQGYKWSIGRGCFPYLNIHFFHSYIINKRASAYGTTILGEIGSRAELHDIARKGVDKPQMRSVKHKAPVRLSIKFITHNGSIETVLMRAMHTQLMRAPRERIESHKGTPASAILLHRQELIFSDSLLAAGIIDLLRRTVEIIGRERKGYYTIAVYRNTVEQCHIFFRNLATRKKSLHSLVGFNAFCRHQKPRRRHIKTVCHKNIFSAKMTDEPLLQRLPSYFSGHREQTRRFIGNNEPLIFVENFNIARGGGIDA